MKKIIVLTFILCAVASCSQKADVAAVKSEFGDNPGFQMIEKYSNAENLTQADNELYALQCMIFANSAKNLNATLYMREKLEALTESYPENAMIFAYYASVVGMAARDDEKVANKMKYAEKSIKLLKKAVSLDSNNQMVRLSRGHTSYNMPAMLNQQDVARDDYDFLIACHSDESSSLSEELMAEVYFNRADLARQEGDLAKAKLYYTKVSKIAPESDLSPLAAKQVELLQ